MRITYPVFLVTDCKSKRYWNSKRGGAKRRGRSQLDKEICHLFSPEASGQLSLSVAYDTSWHHGLQKARLPCPSPTPRACSNSCPLSRWCHLTISSSKALFSSCSQSFPTWGSFPMSQLFASGSQSVGASASASVLPMNVQGVFPLGLTGLISLQSKGFSRV